MNIPQNFDLHALTGSMFDFARPSGPDILKRTADFENWRSVRSQYGLWPFSRVIHSAPGAEMYISDERGNKIQGISFSCQDYLGLTSHPSVREAAVKALKDMGPHSAGSPALAGNTHLSLLLEKELGETLGYEHIVLFPTGWAAGYAGIAGLVRPEDYIVMDQLSHACLQQGAYAATRNIRRYPHLDNSRVEAELIKIRSEDTKNGILVITEGLFSMDSDIPAIGQLQEICRKYSAILLVDVAHDFGSLGKNGGGSLENQNLIGKVDLVMGSFSKTFASNGGFVATHSEAVRQYFKFYGSPQTFSNALSPVQASVIRETLRIVRSDEGQKLREKMVENSKILREELEKRGVKCIGTPSAIVPAYVGNEAVARIAWAEVSKKGIHANIVEFPAVAVGAARFRMQLMPAHTREHLIKASTIVSDTISEVKEMMSRIDLPKPVRPKITRDSKELALGEKALPSLKEGDLEKLYENSKLEQHKAGTIFIQAGSNHGLLYIIRKGLIHIVIDHNDQHVTLAECGEGEIIGEISMLDGKGASASVIAETDIEVASIDQKTIAKLVKSDPEFGARLYQSLAIVLAKRLRSQNIHILPVEFSGH